MNYEDAKQSIIALKDYIQNSKISSDNNDELGVKKAQLRVIEKTIKQLERKGLPVPEVLYSEKSTFISEIKSSNTSDTSSLLYEDLLDVLLQIGRILGRTPHRDLYLLSKKERTRSISKSILRSNIIDILNTMGGSGQERDILDAIAHKYEGQFSAADLEKPHGKSPRWETNVRAARNRMIRDGILTRESRRKIWTLVK